MTKRAVLSFLIIMIVGVQVLSAQDVLKQLLDNGPTNKRINIVFLSEGFTAAQLPRFITEATTDLNAFLNTAPNSSYQKYFNAFTISVASVDSGSDHPSRSVYRNTYFNSTYDTYGINRLVTLNSAGMSNAYMMLQNYMPEYDIVILIVNDPEYGGSGGPLSVTSVNSSALEIVSHELGHSFAKLGDEYGDPYPGYPDVEEPNTTIETVRENIKWNSWIMNSTPIPTPKTIQYASNVGLFEGAHYHSTGWFRPKLNCKMQSLGTAFCEICSETFVKSYYTLLHPIESFSPDTNVLSLTDTQSVRLSVTHMKPKNNTFQIQWFINGRKITEQGSELSLSAKELGTGQHTVFCMVRDTTPLVRNDPGTVLRDGVSWSLSVSTVNSITNGNNRMDPEHFSLEQNFPNPFNPVTTIAFSIPTASFVTLTIYDVLGRKIETLVSETMPSGRFMRQWNAEQYSAGMYWYELQAGNVRKTNKLVLLK